MSEARFLFLLTEGFRETVIDSQVVDPVVLLGRAGIPFDLLALVDGREYLQRRTYYKARRLSIAARTGRRVGLRPLVRKWGRLGQFLGLTQLSLDFAVAGFRRTVIHARGDRAAYLAAGMRRLVPNVRFVYDSRGDREAEYLLLAKQRGASTEEIADEAAKIDRTRAVAVAQADHVLCVSTPLRDLLVRRYRLDPERCTVVPCAADEEKFHPDKADRAAARSALGLTDRFVLIYPGRFGRWHYNDETFRVVRGLLDADESIFFLIITPDREAAVSLASALLPDGRYAIRSAEHGEVPRFLRAADLGILLRERNPVNLVACPTKFAEFVMSGLPVLISAEIGDCSAFVAEHDAGIVLEDPIPVSAVSAVEGLRQKSAESRRARIAALGRERFSRQRFALELAQIYNRLGMVS
jgi:glycosyltransferase involved in cell wall biosynthesis